MHSLQCPVFEPSSEHSLPLSHYQPRQTTTTTIQTIHKKWRSQIRESLEKMVHLICERVSVESQLADDSLQRRRCLILVGLADCGESVALQMMTSLIVTISGLSKRLVESIGKSEVHKLNV